MGTEWITESALKRNAPFAFVVPNSMGTLLEQEVSIGSIARFLSATPNLSPRYPQSLSPPISLYSGSATQDSLWGAC